MEESQPNIVVRNPVAIWGSLSMLAGAALKQFAPDLNNDFIEAVVSAIFTFGPTAGTLVYIWLKVTPVAAPKNDLGQKLVPEYVADAAEINKI